jgi:hypothetical protein
MTWFVSQRPSFHSQLKLYPNLGLGTGASGRNYLSSLPIDLFYDRPWFSLLDMVNMVFCIDYGISDPCGLASVTSASNYCFYFRRLK